MAVGLNPEGGSRSYRFATRSNESVLGGALRVGRERTSFFLRAESYYNVGTEIERLDKEPGGPLIIDSIGEVSPHERSHGPVGSTSSTSRRLRCRRRAA